MKNHLHVAVTGFRQQFIEDDSHAHDIEVRVSQLLEGLDGGGQFVDEQEGGEVGAVGGGQDHRVQPQEGDEHLRGAQRRRVRLRLPQVHGKSVQPGGEEGSLHRRVTLAESATLFFSLLQTCLVFIGIFLFICIIFPHPT